jgi:hypothetical protein
MLTKTSSTSIQAKSKYIACSNTKIQLDVSIKALEKLDATIHKDNQITTNNQTTNNPTTNNQTTNNNPTTNNK